MSFRRRFILLNQSILLKSPYYKLNVNTLMSNALLHSKQHADFKTDF